MKKIKWAFFSMMTIALLICIPVIIGALIYNFINEPLGIALGIVAFIFLFFLIVAFTSDWESLN